MRFDDDVVHGYLAEGADKLTPTPSGQTLLYYQEGGTALVATSNSALLAFPFETVVGEAQRDILMSALLTIMSLSPDEAPNLRDPQDPEKPNDPETSGCGCRTTNQPFSSLAPWLLLLAFEWVRRRQRS